MRRRTRFHIGHRLVAMLGLPAVVLGVMVATQSSLAQPNSEQPELKAIEVSEVPQAAREAARRELGTAPTRAKILVGTKPQQYELVATNWLGNETTSVRVEADGTVTEKKVKLDQ